MDIGGDKSLPYMQLPQGKPILRMESNRICLDRTEIIKTQFKALLKLSKYGYIKIMLPMIMDIEEIRRARILLEECKKELRKKI